MTEPAKKPARKLLRAWPLYLTTRFFVLFGAVSAALTVLYFVSDGFVYVLVGANTVMLLAVVVDYVASPSAKDLRVERFFPYPFAVDKANDVHLIPVNTAGRSLQLRIFDDYPEGCTVRTLPMFVDVPPGSSIRTMYKLTPRVRGNGMFGNIHYWYQGPLKLMWKKGVSWAQQDVKFYPGLALIERQRLRLHRMSSEAMVRPLLRRGDGTEFDSLREYVLGDDPRLINWAVTARRGRPVVRVNRMERSQNVFIVLDAGRMMTARVKGRTKFDYAVNAALLLAYGALEVGDNVGFMVVGRDTLCFHPPEGGSSKFGRILEALYAIEPKMEEPRYYIALADVSLRLKKRSLIIVFTDLIDERASLGLKRYVLQLIPRHLPLVAVMSDTEVTSVANSMPETEEDLYRKGVASEALERRGRLLAGFASVGIYAVDTPPERLSSALLDRYLEIKTKGRL